MTQVFPGQILGGKYRVDRVLGAGGMGMVVAATHLHLDERVAIKFLLPEAMGNPEAVARFGREARAAVKIRGEHVARVIDVGAFENGAPYMVMEYLDGRDLSALITERGALSPADAVDAVLQACEALAEAHALGIVHRDLKPANLFLTRRPDGTPSVKVLDFGISKVTNASASDNAMTKTSAIMGSPLYMSPEQMTASRDVDARTDIWAIGVVLYELLAGRAPFRAETLPEICGLILTSVPPAIRDFSPSTPELLQSVVLRCLEKDRSRRYQSVSELAQAIAPFGSRATSRSVERISRILGANPALYDAPASVPLAANGGAGTQSNWGQTNPPRSNTVPLMVAGAAAVVLVGGLGALWSFRSKPVATDHAVAAAASVVATSVPVVSAAAPAPPPAVVPAPVAAAPSTPPAVVAPVAKAVAAHPAVVKATAAKPAPLTAPAAVAPPPRAKKSAEDMMSGRD
ncbi:MAG TPA: serine/threonine-protein kinase [Polyangiaceae bacterium]